MSKPTEQEIFIHQMQFLIAMSQSQRCTFESGGIFAKSNKGAMVESDEFIINKKPLDVPDCTAELPTLSVSDETMKKLIDIKNILK